METRPLKIVIVGHVDHGKSTLIGRLLFDTDSLPKDKMREIKEVSKALGKEIELAFLIDHLKEEREKNMTIDTSQIHFKTKKRNYVIIDAPGHFEFTKNMITGASQADAALLVIDSSLGIQEQTQRHAYLLKWLGCKKLIVLINKMDLIHYEEKIFRALQQEISAFLEKLKLSPSFIIPVSAKEGIHISKLSSSMPWFKGPDVLKALDSFRDSSQELSAPLRFPIQDVYEIDGQKIIVGKIASGTLSQNQKVILLPSGKKASVHKIITFDDPKKKKAIAEENIGLELDWLNGNPDEVKRGDVMIAAGDSPLPLPTPTLKFRGNLFWMAEKSLALGETLTLRSTTQQALVKVETIEKRMNSSTLELIEKCAQELKMNEAASVIFKTKMPLILDTFSSIEETGRFVVEQNFHVQGAGTVQDNSIGCRSKDTNVP